MRVCIPIIHRVILEDVGGEEEDNERIEETFREIPQEIAVIKESIQLSLTIVIPRIREERFDGVLTIVRREENDGHRCEACIVQLVEPWIVESNPRESVQQTEPPLRQDKQQVLVEVVEHELTVLTVTLTSEVEEELTQVSELRHSIVA